MTSTSHVDCNEPLAAGECNYINVTRRLQYVQQALVLLDFNLPRRLQCVQPFVYVRNLQFVDLLRHLRVSPQRYLRNSSSQAD